MRTTLIIICIAFSYSLGMSQTGDFFMRTAGFVKELKPKQETKNNTVYLNDDWKKYDFELVNGQTYEGVMTKFDLDNNQFEIKYNGQIKVLPSGLVKTFKYEAFDSGENDEVVFYNARSFVSSHYNRTGFLEALYLGEKVQVLKQYYVHRIPPTFNAALDVGDKNEKLVKKEDVIVFQNGEWNGIESSKKKNLALFDGNRNEVASYVKTNKLSFKEEDHLVKIFKYYENL